MNAAEIVAYSLLGIVGIGVVWAIGYGIYVLFDSAWAPKTQESAFVVAKNFTAGHWESHYNVALKMSTSDWVADRWSVCMRTPHGDVWRAVNRKKWWEWVENGAKARVKYRVGRFSHCPRFFEFV